SWLGWGGGIRNDRLAGRDASLSLGNIELLTQSCKQDSDPGVSAAPLVENAVAYYPTWSGLLVALDYKACKKLWTVNITSIILEFAPLQALQVTTRAASRTTPVTEGNTLFIGTLAHALILAIGKRKGDLIDIIQMDEHPLAIITQSPTMYQGRVFVGVSSTEVSTPALFPNYTCCSHVGSMSSVVLKDGRLHRLWTQPMLRQPANVSGPIISGASVWGSQPAVDHVHNQIFISTGNIHSLPTQFTDCQVQIKAANITLVEQGLVSDPCLPENVYQETILALDIDTGRINWAHQTSNLDNWNTACIGNDPYSKCPTIHGPDADFGMAPTFVVGSINTPDNIDVVVAGQKNGNLYMLSASTGSLLWSTVTGPGGFGGGLCWGVAVDDAAVYFTAVNTGAVTYQLQDGGKVNNSVFGAINLVDGRILWQSAAPDGLFSTIPLDAKFRGGIAVVEEYAMFGTGYWSSLYTPPGGSFQVWKA
ncbi:Quino protein alcohol dehydrogenase-like protein, partial [Thozetella sp. PMI_491]